jgi:hypothetical protein
VRVEAQEYRENVRKQKTKMYEQYLWRKAMLASYAKQVDFMMSPEWETTYSATLERHASSDPRPSHHTHAAAAFANFLLCIPPPAMWVKAHQPRRASRGSCRFGASYIEKNCKEAYA